MRLVLGDRHLLALVEAVTGAAATQAGSHLVCRPGCTPCCIGPFPISQLDAWRLRTGLSVMAALDPDRAAAVRERAARDVVTQSPWFPGDADGTFEDDEARAEAFCARFDEVPCPVLDPVAGTCDLYEYRPIPCRTYGPPMRVGNQEVPHCHLCFTTARPEQIDAARQTLDVADLEHPMTDEVEAETQRFGMTTVAFAIASPPAKR